MNSSEIRQSFLDFFKSKQHHIVPSAPVVPQDDPTLLFINAGMNPFKDIFLGSRTSEHPRVADSQKCIRVSGKHNDLEEVGRDTYHHTFFEMLGNWSFGNYFKPEAIAWAWELLTGVWKLPKERLFATIFEGDDSDGVPRDDEAGDEWKRQTDIRPEHILAFGKKDNFWEMGDTGPCGPCSEIHIDRGAEYCDKQDDPNHECQVNGDCARFIELWNLVFIQYNREKSGKLHQLPAKHVDTGAGFERLVAVLQKKASNYDTDLFTPLLQHIGELTGKPYSDGETGVAFRVIADHIRSLSFAIADGAIPGNEGRGYVLRRILRRAARFGRVLEKQEPFIYKLLDTLVAVMGDAYPEIQERKEYIQRVIKAEEESFGRTLDRGIELFEQKAAAVQHAGNTVFPGKDAFVLHDTYGFPLDLTQLMAEEKNLTVDVSQFNAEMEKQRERSSQSREAEYKSMVIEGAKATEFVGYLVDETEAQVVQFEDGKLVLNKTPFYAESGGQVGDTGVIKNESFEFHVADTKYIGEHIVHFGELTSGSTPQLGDTVVAHVDTEKRRATERNHTVTHLAHKALRTVLGEHVHQAGSLVHPDYMRFDFTHFERVNPQDLRTIEDMVNQQILANRKTEWKILPIEDAKAQGAVALFGEKYGDTVRMVEIENYSRELCGGTHVRATGEIGEFVIINETSIAAGVRRIECLTGMKAHEYLRSRNDSLEQAAALLGCAPNETQDRLQALLEERKAVEQELKQLRQVSSKDVINELLNQTETVDGVAVIAARVPAGSVDELREKGDLLRDGLGSGVGVLGAVIQDKLSFVCIVTQDLIKDKGLKAGDIVKQVASVAGGGGGGSPHMALAGAKDVSQLDAALSRTKEIVAELIK